MFGSEKKKVWKGNWYFLKGNIVVKDLSYDLTFETNCAYNSWKYYRKKKVEKKREHS